MTDPKPPKPADGVVLTFSEALEQYHRYRDIGRLPTGMRVFDATIGGGLPRGQVVGIVGGTGVRKSELIRHWADSFVKQKVGVVLCDVELGTAQLLERAICNSTKLPKERLGDMEAMAEVGAAETRLTKQFQDWWRIVVPYTVMSRVKLERMLESAISELRTTNPEVENVVVMCDSVQRLAPGFSNSAGDTRVGVQNFMYWFDMFTRRMDVAGVVTSERSRPKERKDLKADDDLASAKQAGAESRAIEYASHALILLLPVYEKTTPTAGASTDEAEDNVRMMLAKNRSGQEGWVKLNLVFERPHWGLHVENWDSDHPLATKKKSGTGVKDQMLVMEKFLKIMADGKRHPINQLRSMCGVSHETARKILVDLAESGQIVEEYNLRQKSMGWRRMSEAEKIAEAKRMEEESRRHFEVEAARGEADD